MASGIVEGPEGVLLVCNRRTDGRSDWSPPGGVIEVAAGESVVDGLTREVAEESGIVVSDWEGPVYEVEAVARDMGWHLQVEVYLATVWSGELMVDDPDGIVVDAAFFSVERCADLLSHTWLPTHEPLGQWLAERWVRADARSFRYRVEGADRASMSISRL